MVELSIFKINALIMPIYKVRLIETIFLSFSNKNVFMFRILILKFEINELIISVLVFNNQINQEISNQNIKKKKLI
jgi:hypothetical protein